VPCEIFTEDFEIIMKLKNIKYMHTMDGKPGYYVEGEQIYFASRGSFGAVRLVDSVEQIHKNEKASDKYRISKGMDARPWGFGWVKVKI
jgi:hypothetical protein